MTKKRDKRVKRMRRQASVRPSYVGRRRTVTALFALSAAVLVWRAFDQQILEKDFLQAEGADRYLDTVEVAAHRGLITDRHGAVLAVSTPVESLGADPRRLRLDDRTLPQLARILKMKSSALRARLERFGSRQFVYLKRRMEPDQAAAVRVLVQQAGLVGVRLDREYRRYYPAGEVFSQVLGFTDVDDQGQEGLELAFDKELAGHAGEKRVLRDGHRKVVADVENIRMPQPGRHLALSMDRRLQFIAYRELLAAVRKHQARAGSALVLDVRTGEILAVVNQPSFNPNRDREALRGRQRNRALTDVYEPGSTMKPFTIAIALESGQYAADTLIDTSPGYFHVGASRVSDHHDLGVIDVATVLQRSSNVGVGKIALDLPRQATWQFLSDLGFGTEPGAGFPGEASGKLIVPAQWAAIDQVSLAYGYSLSVTTLQLARAYAAIAADGVTRPVSLLRLDEAPTGRRVFSVATSRALRRMLEAVVSEEGTAPQAAIPGYRVAGKTGTAKKSNPDGGYSDERYRALFAGMVPASDPRLIMVVVIDEPRAGKIYGGDVAAPVFAAVMDDALRLLNIAPDALPVARAQLVQVEAKP